MLRFITSRRNLWTRLGLLALVGIILTSLVVLQAEMQSVEASSITIDDSSGQIRWGGYWVTKRDAGAVGGAERVVNGVGARATLQVRASKVTIVYTQAPDRAIANVTIDGVRKPAIDQYGPLTYRQTASYQLAPGLHTIVITNAGSRNARSRGWWTGVDAIIVEDGAAAPAPAATPSRTPLLVPTGTATSTAVPATATPTSLAPTATSTLVPTATATSTTPPATPTAPPPTATASDRPRPVAGQPCPQWYHDAITTTGPDGKLYPTWHPAVDPVSGCFFGHEHGDDPRTSRADPTMPAFGYIGQLVGDNEPHVGFKVFVQNAGARNDDWRVLAHDSRMVFHMGTGGPKRFTTRFHSLEYDFIARDGSGHEVHVMGMADTGGVGSICSEPRQGKTVMLLPGLCPTDSLYEIWAVSLNVGDKASINAAFATFDPITLLDPADPTRVLNTVDFYPRFGPALDCKREAYSGPVFYYNRNGPVTFRTDAYGRVDPNGPLVQHVSRHSGMGVMMTTDGTQTQAKLGSMNCAPGLRAPN